MRTLKKTLSLLLAVALVLSLTVVGASAAYTGNKVDTLKDAADVGADYSEAVGVMVGLGIIEGYDDGTLRPETTYTREQAAKIIAYMQLGPKDADSLRCTKAPFTDVAADRWSAGYIAYCVEQGIIDGMGDGTFQPEAQLTGYQWAKMLLCAVGYGRNDEYVGSSWSLNTAKDALDKGIFEGDLVGADHTPLQRQQAILYAFNTLTSVGVVVYSPSLGDYILRYTEFADRATIEGTLGEQVYKLDVDTGIIVDNEAMGAAKTVLSVQGKYAADANAKGDDADVSVAANTGLDMMYHAAKIWHANGTAVFVIDLAKVETLACGEMSGIAKLEKGKTVTDKNIGDTSKTKYEYYFIDNTAINANYAGVTVWASLEALGTRSETKKTTVIGNYKAVSNDYIKTDISEINKRDNVVVIKAGEKAYHVFALGATSGTVKSLSSSGVITLADGTVLAPSVFAEGRNGAALAEMRAALAGDLHVAPVYAFVLDTHGHYIDVTNNPYRTVAYFTGATKLSSAHDAWSSDVQWMAQFVDVATGDVEEIPVSNAWISTIVPDYVPFTDFGGYYDITDELYGDETYNPAPVNVGELYGTSYVVTADREVTFFNATSNYVDTVFDEKGDSYDDYDEGILYNNANVKFIIASHSGSRLVVDEYTGVAEMLAAYAEKYNTPVSTVSLTNIAMVVERSDAGNYYATTIFAYDGALGVAGGTIFFPTGLAGDQWTVYDDYFTYDYAYIDGEQAGTLKFPIEVRNYDRGFYEYIIDDQTGYYTLRKIETNYVSFGENAMKGDGTGYYLEENPISADVKIVDTRTDADVEVDSISELKDLVSHNYTDAWEKTVDVAYHLNAAGQVDLIYVVDNEFGSAVVTTTATGWSILDTGNYLIDHTFQAVPETIIYNDTSKVTMFLPESVAKLAVGGKLDVAYTVDDDPTDSTPAKAYTTTGIIGEDNTLVIDFKGTGAIPGNASRNKVVITDITAHLNITNKTGIEGSSLREANGYKDLKAGAKDDTYTLDMTITEAAGGYKVVLEGADIVKGTKVNVEGFEAEVPTNNAVRITISAGEPVANIDAVIGKVTLDTTITVHHDILAYWDFAGEDHVTIENAVLGDSINVTLDRVDFSSFHSGDSVTFANVYGDSVTSSAMENNQVTLKVTPNSNDALLQGGTDVCPHT